MDQTFHEWINAQDNAFFTWLDKECPEGGVGSLRFFLADIYEGIAERFESLNKY